MALIKCKECNKEVSSTAGDCPACGAKVVAPGSVIAVVVAAALCAWFLYPTLLEGLAGTEVHAVEYVVEGTARTAGVTYHNEQGGTQQEMVRVPWSMTMPMETGDFLYVSAQNQAESGELTIRILVDGNEFKRSDARGGYTIASASGSCP